MKKEVEFALEFTNIQRPTFSFLDYDTFLKKYKHEEDEVINSFNIEIPNSEIMCIYLNEDYDLCIAKKVPYVSFDIIFQKPLTRKNYIKACRICKNELVNKE